MMLVQSILASCGVPRGGLDEPVQTLRLTTETVSVEERVQRIATLDLECIRRGLLKNGKDDQGDPWTEDRINQAINWYRRMLEISVKYPDFNAVPGQDIDDAWHQHIMNTKLYGRDCLYALGFFLHHTPFGYTNAETGYLEKQYKATHALYRREFGEIPPFQRMARCDDKHGKCVDCYTGQ